MSTCNLTTVSCHISLEMASLSSSIHCWRSSGFFRDCWGATKSTCNGRGTLLNRSREIECEHEPIQMVPQTNINCMLTVMEKEYCICQRSCSFHSYMIHLQNVGRSKPRQSRRKLSWQSKICCCTWCHRRRRLVPHMV